MQRVFAGWLVFAAVTCSIIGIGLMAAFPLGSFVRFGWPLEKVLAWDAALSLLFFLQHSGMVRRPVRRFLHIPEPYWAASYAAASGIALAAVMVLWQASDVPLLVLTGWMRTATHVCGVLALLFFIWGIVALKSFDPCGIGPVKAHLRGVENRPMPFVARGPYRWVRHPLYFAILILFWVYPDLTLDRLLFDVLWTAWIIVGTRLEERDLLADFGEDYARYCGKVPSLIPWRGPARI
jgi:methanethiol S-methyltransferase